MGRSTGLSYLHPVISHPVFGTRYPQAYQNQVASTATSVRVEDVSTSSLKLLNRALGGSRIDSIREVLRSLKGT